MNNLTNIAWWIVLSVLGVVALLAIGPYATGLVTGTKNMVGSHEIMQIRDAARTNWLAASSTGANPGTFVGIDAQGLAPHLPDLNVTTVGCPNGAGSCFISKTNPNERITVGSVTTTSIGDTLEINASSVPQGQVSKIASDINVTPSASIVSQTASTIQVRFTN